MLMESLYGMPCSNNYFAKRDGFVRDNQTNFDGYAIIMYRVNAERDKLIFDWSNAITL